MNKPTPMVFLEYARENGELKAIVAELNKLLHNSSIKWTDSCKEIDDLKAYSKWQKDKIIELKANVARLADVNCKLDLELDNRNGEIAELEANTIVVKSKGQLKRIYSQMGISYVPKDELEAEKAKNDRLVDELGTLSSNIERANTKWVKENLCSAEKCPICKKLDR